MKKDIGFPNEYLGRKGWFYWGLFPLILGPILFLSIFSFSIFNRDYSEIEKLIIFLGIIFFLYFIFNAIQILWLGSKTAKEVKIINSSIVIKTYTGRIIKFANDFEKVKDVTQEFNKKHLRVLYPKGSNIISIKSNNKEYYLPISKEGLGFFDFMRES